MVRPSPRQRGAGVMQGVEALGDADLPRSGAFEADLGSLAALGAAAVAVFADGVRGLVYLHCIAQHRLLQFQQQDACKVRASAAGAASGPAEHVAEYVAENIVEPGAAVGRPGDAELIVGEALVAA